MDGTGLESNQGHNGSASLGLGLSDQHPGLGSATATATTAQVIQELQQDNQRSLALGANGIENQGVGLALTRNRAAINPARDATGESDGTLEEVDYAQHVNVEGDTEGNVQVAAREGEQGGEARMDQAAELTQNQNQNQHQHQPMINQNPNMGIDYREGNGQVQMGVEVGVDVEVDAQGEQDVMQDRQRTGLEQPAAMNQIHHPSHHQHQHQHHLDEHGNPVDPHQAGEHHQHEHHLEYQEEPSLWRPYSHAAHAKDLDPRLKEPIVNLDYEKDSIEKIASYRSSPETYHLVEKFIGMNPENFDRLLKIIQDHHLFASSRQKVEKQVAVYLYSRTWNASFKQISKCCGCSMATVAAYKERVEEVMLQRQNAILREVRSKLWNHYPNLADEPLDISDGEETIKTPLRLNQEQESIIRSGHQIIQEGGSIISSDTIVHPAPPNQGEGENQEVDALSLMTYNILVDANGNQVDLPEFSMLLQGNLEEETDPTLLLAKVKARNLPTLSYDDLVNEWRRVRKYQRARDRNEKYLSETNRLIREQEAFNRPKKNRKKRKDARDYKKEEGEGAEGEVEGEGDMSMMNGINMSGMEWNPMENGQSMASSSSIDPTQQIQGYLSHQIEPSHSNPKRYSSPKKSVKQGRNSDASRNQKSSSGSRDASGRRGVGRTSQVGGSSNSHRDSDDESDVSLNESVDGPEVEGRRGESGKGHSNRGSRPRRSSRSNKNRMSLNEDQIGNPFDHAADADADADAEGEAEDQEQNAGEADAEGEEDLNWNLDIDESPDSMRLLQHEEESEREKILKEIFDEKTSLGGSENLAIEATNGASENSTFRAQNILLQTIEEERELKKTFQRNYQDEVKRIKQELENQLKEKLRFVKNKIKVVGQFCSADQAGGDEGNGNGNGNLVDGLDDQGGNQTIGKDDHSLGLNDQTLPSNSTKRKLDSISGENQRGNGEISNSTLGQMPTETDGRAINPDQDESNKRLRTQEDASRIELEMDPNAILAAGMTGTS